jgi:hypothetical protein
MNGPDHYGEAERFLEEAESCEEPGSRAMWCLELAKLPRILRTHFLYYELRAAIRCNLGLGCPLHNGVQLMILHFGASGEEIVWK